jgi:integrase
VAFRLALLFLLYDLPEKVRYPVRAGLGIEELPMSAQLRLVTPRRENRSVPARPPNAELRTREYLASAEVVKLIKAAGHGRCAHRDATLILIAFRHGLRAAEICDLEWSQVEFGRSASLHVRRKRSSQEVLRRLISGPNVKLVAMGQ